MRAPSTIAHVAARAQASMTLRAVCALAPWLLVLGLTGTGCRVITLDQPPPLGNPTPRDAGPQDLGGFPDAGPMGLLLDRVEPPHGPFSGDQEVTLRGVGFTPNSVVTFAGVTLPANDTRYVDGNRIRVLTPASAPGPAEVSVRSGERVSTLAAGYVYDSLALDPTRGSVAGGTRIEITGLGASFSDTDEVRLGGVPCSAIEVPSPSRLVCVAPAAPPGTVDVSYRAAGSEPIVLTAAFTYFDASDPIAGGLGGGVIQGSVNVTVISRLTGGPLPEAFVMLGTQLPAQVSGRTDIRGQVTLSAVGLAGPQTLTVAAYCHEKTTIVDFDAASVTVFLEPWLDVGCVEIVLGEMMMGFPRVGIARNGAFIEGELRFPGPNEHAPNGWDSLPTPRAGEVRVAYVQTTTACATCRNIAPGGPAGTSDRITEDMQGVRGNPFRIASRASALAVFAIAGIENTQTGQFAPYVMGMRRGVLLGPEQTLSNVELQMNIPLDQPLDIELSGLPAPSSRGPDRFVVRATLDLGGEGFLRPFARLNALDEVVRLSSEGIIRLVAQPPLTGPLFDGRYFVDAAWVTGATLDNPSTHVVRSGVRPLGGSVSLAGFVGLPEVTAPTYGQLLPADRILRWDVTGPEPDVWMIYVEGSDGNAQWRHFVRGDARQAPLPDLSAEDEIADVSPGPLRITIYGINVADFDFDSFTYSSLSSQRWSAWSVDTIVAQR
ncbi:MAG: IPT/TIG domain-containing protein [Sandaracinaceae bacterium]|nr:IPT/TIG domain-containing protein [Sandaracinaceae bacterium]